MKPGDRVVVVLTPWQATALDDDSTGPWWFGSGRTAKLEVGTEGVVVAHLNGQFTRLDNTVAVQFAGAAPPDSGAFRGEAVAVVPIAWLALLSSLA